MFEEVARNQANQQAKMKLLSGGAWLSSSGNKGGKFIGALLNYLFLQICIILGDGNGEVLSVGIGIAPHHRGRRPALNAEGGNVSEIVGIELARDEIKFAESDRR